MKHFWLLLGRALRSFQAHQGLQSAAAIAFHLVFSFIPLSTVLLAALGFLLRDPDQRQRVLEYVLTALPLQSDAMVHDSILGLSQRSGTLTVLGLLGLVWAASGLFGAIRVAFNVAWSVQSRRRYIMDKLFDIVAVIALGGLLTVSLVGTVMIHILQTLSRMQSGALLPQPLQMLFTALGLAIPAAVSFVLFLLLYRYIPSVKHRLEEVWPGALLAALLFELAKHGFALYVAHLSSYQAMYGALGAVMLIMLWTQISAIILLLGAELAAQYSSMKRERPRQLKATGASVKPTGSAPQAGSTNL